eukprot:jgi/Botrbrau1/229/Bobra.0022s0208.1
MLDALPQLQLPEDKLTTLMECAQVLGLGGACRKRTLLLWQAIEFARSLERPNLHVLQVARKALEPPDDPSEQEEVDEITSLARRPSPEVVRNSTGARYPSGLPRNWGSVYVACLDAVLQAAIVSQRHADVWEAAAALLRCPVQDVGVARQESLVRTLEAAAAQMPSAERVRAGPGPPPLLSFRRAVSPDASRSAFPLRLAMGSSTSTSNGPFIYNPYAAKEKEKAQENSGPVRWIAGERAYVEIEIRNPTTVPIKVERLTLEAVHVGDAGQPPVLAMSDRRVWKPNPVAMFLPQETLPTKVVLEGTPLVKGLFVVTGCKISGMGVTWHQPWTPRPPSPLQALHLTPTGPAPDLASEAGGLAHARVMVVDALPLVEGRVDAPPTSVGPSEDPSMEAASSPRGRTPAPPASPPSRARSWSGACSLPMLASCQWEWQN